MFVLYYCRRRRAKFKKPRVGYGEMSARRGTAAGKSGTPKPQSGGKRLFYSYSHRDESLRKKLETHLAMLRREHVITEWHDRKLLAGHDWETEIDEQVETADIILLLVSSDFLSSDYCFGKEMRRALERQASGEAIVIPIILRDCDWHTAPFSRLQALPTDAKPVTSWANRDEAFKDVAIGIRRTVAAGHILPAQPRRARRGASQAQVNPAPAKTSSPSIPTQKRLSPKATQQLFTRAEARISPPHGFRTSAAELVVVVAPASEKPLIRPSQLDSAGLQQWLAKTVKFGRNGVLDSNAETRTFIRDEALWLSQQDRSMTVCAEGDIVIRQPAENDWRNRSGVLAIIEEDLSFSVSKALRLAAAVLQHIDRSSSVQFVAVIAALVGANYLPWRTRTEHQASPNSATFGSRPERAVAILTPKLRAVAELRSANAKLTADLIALLRRAGA